MSLYKYPLPISMLRKPNLADTLTSRRKALYYNNYRIKYNVFVSFVDILSGCAKYHYGLPPRIFHVMRLGQQRNDDSARNIINGRPNT